MAGTGYNIDTEWYCSDDDRSFQDDLLNILEEDNKDKFLSFLKERYVPGLLPPVLLLVISLSMVRKNVLKLYLKKKLINYDFDIHREDSAYDSPLHLASLCGHPGLCRLLLSHGAQPNIRSRQVGSEIFHNMLPLNCLLDDGLKDSVYFQGRPTFDPADHIFRVIIKLCLPEVRGELKVLSMLLEVTKEAEKEISRYATEGKVIEIAALLIAAREKSKLALMMPVFQLLAIFAKVGDRINAYLKQEQSKKQGGILKNIIRTLALEREDLEEFSCLCLEEGKFVELAALLMVAHERLLGKSICCKGFFVSEPSGFPLYVCLKHEMSSAIYAETISKATYQSSNSVEICKARKKTNVICTTAAGSVCKCWLLY
ncbi:hypothetical protein COLO4_24278 [Corchorus olitorius]|uniref:Uncharacterized protein n=1 Tax=Corchorus olitorius TaxID=93759 RepID=A0A1R3IBT3_9ROSI|nr:hypothetical protein COLO4_24278 [Corchorus olitorius]